MVNVSSDWPALSYEDWSATCDTLHAETQILGKLAVELAPPEPQLQHAALRLTARGWETPTLPAPNGSGAIVVGLDLRTHEAFVEHSEGHETRIALTPHRPVAEVTREVLEAVGRLAGTVEINPTPQEVPWTVPLDEDTEHATYETDQAASYFSAATQAALVLAEFRAPYRGRSSPVNAWWGTFDLAVHFYSGMPADPPVRRVHHSQCGRRTADRDRLVAGGCESTAKRHSSDSRTRRRMGSPRLTWIPGPRAGTPASASSCSTGRSSARARIPTPSRSSSRTPSLATRAWFATGIRYWRTAQGEPHHRSSSAVVAEESRALGPPGDSTARSVEVRAARCPGFSRRP